MEFKELDHLYQEFEKMTEHMAGYPVSQSFDFSKLFRFMKFNIINLGDPFLDGWNYKINTIKLEREVVTQFAELFHAPKDNFWGYVTNGGTEGNLFGLYVARELYPNGIVYYSDQTHYSVPKNLRLLQLPYAAVKSLPNGEIDYEALRGLLIGQKKTPIILANIGTTMKGAVDDICKIKNILNDLKIEQYYIHCDAAFFGMILPFVSDPQPFDFQSGIDSIAMSGYKMLGTPFPCGIVLAKKSHLDLIGSHIEYVGTKDNTIPGGRSGFTPLFLWYELKYYEQRGFGSIVHVCMENAAYAVEKFNETGINAWRNKNSVIVIFPRPSEAVIRKWQLAAEGDIAHIVTLAHINKDIIDKIVLDIAHDLKRES